MQNYMVINRNHVKLIALITMLIDHFALVFIYRGSDYYTYGRFIGRISFPLFLFLFIDSYSHISNKKKSFILLGISAILSEIPFYMINGFHNIMIQWFMVLLALYLSDKVNDKILSIAIFFIFGLFAYYINVDYGYIPYVCLALYILFPKLNFKLIIPALVALLTRRTGCLLAIPILLLYDQNKECNNRLKYLYYIIYPAHLTLFLILQKIYIYRTI